MTPATLAAIEALATKATPRPWTQATHVDEPRAIVACARPNHSLLGLDRDGMAIVDREADAAFIVAAVNAHDVLVAEVRRLTRIDDAVRMYLATWEPGLRPTATNADHARMREAYAALTAALAGAAPTAAATGGGCSP